MSSSLSARAYASAMIVFTVLFVAHRTGATTAAAAAAASSSCAIKLQKGVGFCAGDSYYGLKHNVTLDECCSWCSGDARCVAFTYHPQSQNGGLCSITDKPSVASVPSATGGSKHPLPPPPPGPTPPHPHPHQPCPAPPQPAPAPPPGSRPNLILFLTDDMDEKLGGWSPMTKANKLLAEEGTTAANWYIHTPVCCPSRTELLTGRYLHNVKVPVASEHGCMQCVMGTTDTFESWLFAPHLANAGYRVGVFGKYLNNGVPSCAPPGVDQAGWWANGGGNYYNPTFSHNGGSVTFNNGTFSNYSTSAIGNLSVAWIREQAARGDRPFMAYIAPKAPHIQDGPGWPVALPAPWYRDAFPGLRAPRTPNWNASCPDHHWLIAQQQPMTTEEGFRSDALYRSRWQALLSVDDLVEGVVEEVEAAGLANNTYFFFTSDHGFRAGQFSMPEGKWNVYETDVRIPMVIRGPGVAAGSTLEQIGSNVDVMPTLLGLAGVKTPPTMDGRSLVSHLVPPSRRAELPLAARELLREELGGQLEAEAAPWRTEQLIEYLGLGPVVRYQHLEDSYNNTFRALRVVDKANNINALIAEFTNRKTDYNFTKQPEFYEFYDMNTDPWQMHNIYDKVDPQLKQRLTGKLRQLFTCRGKDCN